MAEGIPKVNPAVYSCPICLENIIRPKRLPCSHTFCEKCLQTLISRASVGKEQEKFDFECPLCRRVTGRPEPGIVVDEWANHFPTNILVDSFVRFIVEKSKDKWCAICFRDDKESKAESWCNDCAEVICASCKHLHQIIGSLQNHKISALSFEDKDDKFTFPELDEPCHLHQGKYVEVVCLDHKKICCCLCVATQHRQCEHVESLNDVAKKIPNLAVESNLDVLSRISTTTKEVLKHKEKAIILLNAQKEDILKNVSEEVSNIKAKLDELGQQFRKNFLKKHEDIEEEMKQCVLDIKHYLLIVSNGKTLLSAVKERGTCTQIFLSTMKIIRDMEDQFQLFKFRNPEDKEYDYKHDHTTLLKQFCENDTINDVKIIGKPTGTLWNLPFHMPSFQIFEKMEKIQPSKIFEKMSNSETLSTEKKGEFQLSCSAEQGVFVDKETLAFVSSQNTL
ncbi:RING finger protein 207-like [Saccostrea echinata]|uniref:RING finger protein 207-like n=1 Tax=Saccostrea echinata TaxID=191078 RepID=UPI002A83E78C|nr:RING finger protein 207-like [Saccostrea echinata]